MLHIRCGDDILPKLDEAGIPGERLRWCDPLCEGPTPGGVTLERWYNIRADFISQAYQEDRDKTLQTLRQQDIALSDALTHDEIVLWFEHDLFDQTILIELLDWFCIQHLKENHLSLICIGEHPNVPRFTGLGNLSAQQLADLLPQRTPVTQTQLDTAERAWIAFTSDNPMDIQDLIDKEPDGSLPFLKPALRRHLQQFPSTLNGLSHTEQLALEVLKEKGTLDWKDLFHMTNAREEAPYLGDTMFHTHLRRLADAKTAPIQLSDNGSVSLTTFGYLLLSGQGDFVKTNGINKWLAGAELRGNSTPWRWDKDANRLLALNSEA